MSVGNLGVPAGSQEGVYVSPETVFGTFVKPTASHGLRVKKSVFTCTQERVNRTDKKLSRSINERITRRKKAEWSLTLYACPSGSAGVAADDDQLIECVLGAKATSASTHVIYTPSLTYDTSVSLHRICGDFAQSLPGSIVTKMEVRVKGEDEVEIEYSGESADYIHTQSTVTSASAASGASAITVADAHDYLAANSIIKLGTNDNGGAGYTVASVSGTTVNLGSALTGNIALAATVVPFFATSTTHGVPLGCFPGTIKLDTVEHKFRELTISIDNKANIRRDTYGSSSADGYTATDFREITINGTTHARAAYGKWIGKSQQFDDVAMEVTLGDTAGARIIITMPYCEFDVIPIEIPETDLCTLTFKGLAKASVTGEDEISIKYN